MVDDKIHWYQCTQCQSDYYLNVFIDEEEQVYCSSCGGVVKHSASLDPSVDDFSGISFSRLVVAPC